MTATQKKGSRGPIARALQLACGLSLCSLGYVACTLTYQGAFDERQCTKTADCAKDAARLGYPLECRAQVCQATACTETSQCPVGTACVDEVCRTQGGALNACEQDRDCAGADERCGFDGVCYKKWGCLDDDPDWGSSDVPLTYRTTVRRAEDATNPAAVGELEVVACGVADPGCTRPSVAEEDIDITDDKVVSLKFESTLPSGFTGYIKFSSPEDSTDPMVPVYRLFNGETPLITTTVDPVRVNGIGTAVLPILAQQFDAFEPIEGAGFLEVHVHDCGGRAAPDISMSIAGIPDLPFLALADNDGGPVPGATTTTTGGAGSLPNLPPDESQVLVLRDEKLDVSVTDSYTVYVHGTAINYVVYYPRRSALKAWLDEAERQGLLP